MDRPAAGTRVALVTGAAGAIGAACVERLAADGFIAVAGWRETPPPGSGPAVRFDVTAAAATEAAVAGGAGAADAAAEASAGLDPPADLSASVEFRRHLASVLVRRALTESGLA